MASTPNPSPQNESLTLQHIIENRTALLADLHRRQGVIRDLVRGVALEYATGLYLYGRAGTAKTHTILTVLEQEIKEPFTYQRGQLSPIGLFELLGEHPDDVIVLDDLVTIFESDVALQILLAALEHPTGSDRGRPVKYRRQGAAQQVIFRGGIVCISNRELHDEEMLKAFKSRVHTLNYDPPDGELGALILDIAQRGGRAGLEGIGPEEATTVAHYVINDMLQLGCRFDVRLFTDKALPLYQQWQDGETESDWRDLVTAAIQEHLVTVRHADERPSRAARVEGLRDIAREILQQHPTRQEQLRAWCDRTGTSTRCFYRRKAELEQ